VLDPYGEGMLRTAFRWALRLALVAALASVLTRMIGSILRREASEGPGVIVGDTWPPVPIKPARQT